MTRREVLEKLEASAHAEAKSNFDYPKDYSVTQALSALAQIEESERLTVEEIEEIIKNYFGYKDIAEPVYNMSFGCSLAQAIYEAQERKRR